MKYIGIKFPDVLAEQMDREIKDRGFSGRSDFIREAVRNFIERD